METKLNQELLECAKINFENLVQFNPDIARHPMYVIAKHQLDEGLGYEVAAEPKNVEL
mgnify:CR=1 FL=1